MMFVIDCSIENVIKGLVELFIEAVCKREEIDWRCINCYEVDGDNDVYVEIENYVEVEGYNYVGVEVEFLMYVIIRKELWKN